MFKFKELFCRRARSDLRADIAQRIAQLEAERDKALFGYNAAIGELKKLLERPAA